MSDYRRLISYIYAYEAQDKGKNVGFAKLEARNGQCKISVNVKRIFVGGSDLEIFLLSGDVEISLGKLYIRNGIGEFHALVNFDNVEQSGLGMPQINGLIIHGQDNSDRYYMTIWEDVGIKTAEVGKSLPKTAGKIMEQAMDNSADLTMNPNNITIGIEDDLLEGAMLEELKPTKPELMPDEIPVNQPELFPQEYPMKQPSTTPQEKPIVQPELYPDEMPTIQPEIYPQEAPTNPMDTKTRGLYLRSSTPSHEKCDEIFHVPSIEEIPTDYPDNMVEEVSTEIGIDLERKNNSGSNISKQGLIGLEEEENWKKYQENENKHNRTLWNNLSRKYPKIQAFDHEHGCEILTIKPQDIGLLPRDVWFYGNNSFLLHGYYNYRYLILAQLLEENGELRYLLGVPGQYNSNEKNMASMFGFTNFVLAKHQSQKEGRFGYWYRDIRL